MCRAPLTVTRADEPNAQKKPVAPCLPVAGRDAYRMRMPTIKRRWTVADLEDLPDRGERHEVIDGALFVTPAPSLDHQAAVGYLHRLLAEYLDVNRIGYAFMAPADVIFSSDAPPSPIFSCCRSPARGGRVRSTK